MTLHDCIGLTKNQDRELERLFRAAIAEVAQDLHLPSLVVHFNLHNGLPIILLGGAIRKSFGPDFMERVLNRMSLRDLIETGYIPQPGLRPFLVRNTHPYIEVIARGTRHTHLGQYIEIINQAGDN
jgi:hypothetical protein